MIKEQEGDELHRTIWQIANDLRGSIDGWIFRQNKLRTAINEIVTDLERVAV